MQSNKPGADEMFCASCGAIIKQRAEICVHCGVRVARPSWMQGPDSPFSTTSPSPKSRLVAGLLGIFLGSLGIHRFYLGNLWIGIIQIIVTLITFGVGSLWGLIEGIIIVAGGTWRDGQGRLLKKYNE